MYTIRDVMKQDWDQVRTIYIDGMATGLATFETEAPSWEQWSGTILSGCGIVAALGGSACTDTEIMGWAKLTPVSSRHVYRGVAEVSVYVNIRNQGLGVGSALLAAIIERSEANGIWTIQAGIFPENTASLALHEKHGFRLVGRRERLGERNGEWKDVLLLERRSERVGV